jgi:hypothetical protein
MRAFAFVLLLAGCATTSHAVVDQATAGDDAIACAARVLAWRGYVVGNAGESSDSLTAEARLAYPSGGAVQEIIMTSVDRLAAPPEIRVSVRAWSYEPAHHSVPTARQSISEIRPSDEAVTDAQLVLTACGVPEKGDR